MNLKSSLKNFRENYVINKVKNTKLPHFEVSPIVRKKIIFSGRIQNVGFRLETYELAKRLNLTGWVKNRNDKKVECEIQGQDLKIAFLIRHLKSLKRAAVSHVEIKELEFSDNETSFIIKHVI